MPGREVLKASAAKADRGGVASLSLSCPVCQADLPLAGDERPGEEVTCAYCGAPCRIKGRPDGDPKDWGVEEDF